MAKRGIDISSHQGNIDLAALKNEIDFVIIRVGYGTKGTLDTKFKRNADLCKSLGIPMGFYWYSYALDVNGAEAEANAFLSAIAPYKPEYGCWFDMEDADGYKKRNGMPSNSVLKEMCYRFCEIVENSGYYAGIYASLSWFNNQLSGNKLNRFDKWVAQWPTSGGKQKGLDVNPDSRKDWSLWQFTSDGKFSGYSGRLDTNYAYRSFPNPKDESEPKPTPEPKPAPAPAPAKQKFSIGDKVVVNGYLYTSANATSPAGSVSNKITNITRYAAGTAHPYNTTGDLGWMNEDSIKTYSAPASKPARTIKKGSRVKFTGTKSYSGLKLAGWTHGYIFDVIEISGDRVVIGKGTAVTSAVNIKDCQLV